MSAGLAAAQVTPVTVRVQADSASGRVEAARVTLAGQTKLTGRDGLAEFITQPGRIRIAAEKDGFHPNGTTMDVDASRIWSVVMQMEPAETLEQEITVYATRTGQRLEDTPLRVEVLDEEEIAEKTMMTPGDIVMMLNETGGLRVQTTSPSLGAASVRIQGMRGRYTRFLTDGLPLFGQQGGGLGLLQIPPMDLGQVEVIKGVASALYGVGAMGGVINLISRRPQDKPVHDFLFNRTTLGGTDGVLFLGSRLSKQWSGTLLGGGHLQQRNDRDGDGWADIAEYQRGIARPRFFWNGGEGRSGFLTGGVTWENRAGGSTAYAEALDTRRYDLGGSVQVLINRRYVVSARGGASTQEHVHQFGEIRERDRHQTWFGEVTARGAAGINTWVAGVAVDEDRYVPRDVRRFAFSYTTPGVFVQDDIAIRPWLSVSASARADFNSEFGTFLSPRVSALLRGGGWTSRLSAGQGFFAPTPLTEETEAAGLTRLSIPRALRAERGRSGSFDLTRGAGPFSATATLFASSVKNPIHVERGPRYEVANLAAPTENRGVELLATLRKSPFAATASYVYVRSRETVQGVTSDVPLTPRHSFGLVGMWEKADVGRFGVECYYTGRQSLEQNPYRSRSESYVIVGFLAEKKVGPLRLFLNAENLADVRQTHWDPLLRPSRAADGRWTVDAWAPLDGRVFNGGVRFRY